jgi:hypothetical protein
MRSCITGRNKRPPTLRVTSIYLFALVLVGCPKSEVTPTPDADVDAGPCFFGDPNKEPELELRALRADGTDVPLVDGNDLAVIFPPQGGRVTFVGVRARNLDGCGIQLTGALRDPVTKQVRLDGRTLNLRREEDGWGTTGRGAETDLASSDAIGDYSNIPLCPNQWADRDVFDQTFELEVVVVDSRKKSVSKKINVIPRCAEPGEKETACRCLCKKGYVLGESCGEDAGVDSGS